jgi:hypothetical protein
LGNYSLDGTTPYTSTITNLALKESPKPNPTKQKRVEPPKPYHVLRRERKKEPLGLVLPRGMSEAEYRIKQQKIKELKASQDKVTV